MSERKCDDELGEIKFLYSLIIYKVVKLSTCFPLTGLQIYHKKVFLFFYLVELVADMLQIFAK